MACRLTAFSATHLFLAHIKVLAFFFAEVLPAPCCAPPVHDYRRLPCSGLTFYSIKGRLIVNGRALQSKAPAICFFQGKNPFMVDVR
jgi:hypothetical protein